MDPNQNQYSIDYLNQIAPQQKKPGMNNKMFFLVIGGGLVLAAIVLILIMTSGGGANSPTQKMQKLAARMTTLESVSKKSQKTLKAGDLRATNSTLTSFLTNANRDIVAPFKTNGVDVTKIDKTITTAENGDALTKKLEDARLNAVFDRTYAREMNYQLATVTALLKDIYNNTNSKSLKEFLTATDNNLRPITKQLSDFSGTNE
jgi:hypothetical protein